MAPWLCPGNAGVRKRHGPLHGQAQGPDRKKQRELLHHGTGFVTAEMVIAGFPETAAPRAMRLFM